MMTDAARGSAPQWRTFAGFGSHLYGAADRRGDGSHVATLWFVALFLPLWPRGSYRVQSQQRSKSSYDGGLITRSTSYSVIPIPLDTRQVARTYAVVLVPLLIFVALAALGLAWAGGLLLAVAYVGAMNLVRVRGSG